VFLELKEPQPLGTLVARTSPPAFPGISGRQLRDSERVTIWELEPAPGPSKVFINVSTGPWLDFPADTTNLPVHSAEGCDARREAHFYRV